MIITQQINSYTIKQSNKKRKRLPQFLQKLRNDATNQHINISTNQRINQ